MPTDRSKFNTYEYKRESYLKRVYRITVEQFDALLSKQKNSCAICGEHSSSFKKGLAVDHCHDTGEIRGILCGTCNRWIVGATKTPELLRKAADYIEKSRTGYFMNPKYIKNVRKVDREV